LKRKPKTLTQRHYQQCLPHPLNVGANRRYKGIFSTKVQTLANSKELEFDLTFDNKVVDFLTPIDIS
jgi:hypothetical protein